MSKLKIYSFFEPNVYVFFALLFLQSACTSTTVDEFRQGQTGITTEESVVILGRRQGNEYETREEFVGCVGDRVSSGQDAITVIPEREFIDAMFPWFEPRTAPTGISNLERLMADELVAQKMEEFGVRYMVWLDGFTETSGRTGSISCTAGPGGAGCFGFGSWEDDSSFNARVWDVKSRQNVGTINTDASGQSYLPALVIPIPLIARVEANACSRLGDQLKAFVKGD
ncbi:MAG: hypothetical protein P8P42_01555 [Gammaproteobacteria bacterium]|nr:hypothetical protein [Gammaproteobacteria bacterium]MDG1952898.1 hypothetical protein [Gammaproteobacteria bacterium]MDG2118983.1 hypothetical protein [Gammaproteobacteria bacterium]